MLNVWCRVYLPGTKGTVASAVVPEAMLAHASVGDSSRKG
jgi:hypothetical protein